MASTSPIIKDVKVEEQMLSDAGTMTDLCQKISIRHAQESTELDDNEGRVNDTSKNSHQYPYHDHHHHHQDMTTFESITEYGQNDVVDRFQGNGTFSSSPSSTRPPTLQLYRTDMLELDTSRFWIMGAAGPTSWRFSNEIENIHQSGISTTSTAETSKSKKKKKQQKSHPMQQKQDGKSSKTKNVSRVKVKNCRKPNRITKKGNNKTMMKRGPSKDKLMKKPKFADRQEEEEKDFVISQQANCCQHNSGNANISGQVTPLPQKRCIKPAAKVTPLNSNHAYSSPTTKGLKQLGTDMMTPSDDRNELSHCCKVTSTIFQPEYQPDAVESPVSRSLEQDSPISGSFPLPLVCDDVSIFGGPPLILRHSPSPKDNNTVNFFSPARSPKSSGRIDHLEISPCESSSRNLQLDFDIDTVMSNGPQNMEFSDTPIKFSKNVDADADATVNVNEESFSSIEMPSLQCAGLFLGDLGEVQGDNAMFDDGSIISVAI